MTTKIDIAHLAFLEMIKDAVEMYGGGPAKSQLLRKALAVAETFPEADYEDIDAWEEAVKRGEHPFAEIEGRSVRRGHIFALAECPFGHSLTAWERVYGELDERHEEAVEEFNRPTRMTRELQIGHGSAVNAFCLIHQPLRAAIARRVTIAGRQVSVVQLACRGPDGTKALADELIAEADTPPELVESFLDRGAACVYLVQIEDEEKT